MKIIFLDLNSIISSTDYAAGPHFLSTFAFRLINNVFFSALILGLL